jgi:hypothetical protein
MHIFAASKPHWFAGLETSADTFVATLNPSELVKLPGWETLRDRIHSSDTTEMDRPYMCGKRTCHARSYKMGWKTFQLAMLRDSHGTMVLDKAKAEWFLNTFDRVFPEIIEWQNEVPLVAHSAGQLRNLFGFPRRCDRIFTSGYERELISWIPQSTVGCITHKAVLKLQALIERENLKWNILNNKHDSLLLEVPDSDIATACDESKKAMAIELVGRDGVQFVMKSEVQVGKNWGSYHPEKNPAGMRGYKG